MDWLNLHISVLDSPEFLGTAPIDRATWLCLLRFCIGQENDGVIVAANNWGDRKWQQLCGITRKEIQRKCSLWRWVGGSLEVNFYPKKKQEEVQSRRKHGKDSAAKRWGEQGSSPNGSPNGSPIADPYAEGKGREGKGREGATVAHPSIEVDETGGTELATAPTITDRELIRPLAGWVRWRTTDPDDEADNVAELAGLVRAHGGEVVATAARTGFDAMGVKLWPNQVGDFFPAVGASRPVVFRSDEHTAALIEARAILERDGFQAVHDRLGFLPGAVPTKTVLMEILADSVGSCLELIGKGLSA